MNYSFLSAAVLSSKFKTFWSRTCSIILWERGRCVKPAALAQGTTTSTTPSSAGEGSGSVWRVLDGPGLAPRRPRTDLLLRRLCALTDRTPAPQPAPLMAQVQFIMFSLLHLWVPREKCQPHQFTLVSPKTEAPRGGAHEALRDDGCEPEFTSVRTGWS